MLRENLNNRENLKSTDPKIVLDNVKKIDEIMENINKITKIAEDRKIICKIYDDLSSLIELTNSIERELKCEYENNELDFLRSLRFIKSDFLDYLELFHLQSSQIPQQAHPSQEKQANLPENDFSSLFVVRERSSDIRLTNNLYSQGTQVWSLLQYHTS